MHQIKSKGFDRHQQNWQTDCRIENSPRRCISQTETYIRIVKCFIQKVLRTIWILVNKIPILTFVKQCGLLICVIWFYLFKFVDGFEISATIQKRRDLFIFKTAVGRLLLQCLKQEVHPNLDPIILEANIRWVHSLTDL